MKPRRRWVILGGSCIMLVIGQLIYSSALIDFDYVGTIPYMKLIFVKPFTVDVTPLMKENLTDLCVKELLTKLNFSIKSETQPSFWNFLNPLPVSSLKEPSCQKIFKIETPISRNISQSLECFKRDHFSKLRRQISYYLKFLDKLFTDAKIDLILYAGSVLGSWRHHSLIPYDDDIDMIIDEQSKAKGYETLSMLHKHDTRFRFRPYSWFPFPYFWKLDIGCKDQSKTWNCIITMDIFFMRVRGKKEVYLADSGVTLPYSVVFPLRRRPFANYLLFSFHRLDIYLKSDFGKNVNQCILYGHFKETPKSCDRTSIECKLLHNIHPFVIHTRTKLPNQTSDINQRLELEFLTMKSKIIGVFYYTLEQEPMTWEGKTAITT